MRRKHRCNWWRRLLRKLVEQFKVGATEREAELDIRTCALRKSGRGSETL